RVTEELCLRCRHAAASRARPVGVARRQWRRTGTPRKSWARPCCHDRGMARTAADVLVDSGRWLRDSRLHRGLRQRELADLTGVSTSTISRIELGQGGSVPMATWLRLADAVEVDLVRRA